MSQPSVRIELVAGTGYTRSGQPIKGLERKIQAVERKASQLFGGATVIPSHGVWLDHGKAVSEPGITTIIFAPKGSETTAKAQQLAAYTRAILSQNSVALSQSPANFEFVERPA